MLVYCFHQFHLFSVRGPSPGNSPLCKTKSRNATRKNEPLYINFFMLIYLQTINPTDVEEGGVVEGAAASKDVMMGRLVNVSSKTLSACQAASTLPPVS